ncbi:MAG TPA: dephospho-CoA kinase [Flavobacteriales bacterium]|jgi:dephospho-CoA kinase|nr:dephospho-CoA kinase [Flavobacteriales bacterium]
MLKVGITGGIGSGKTTVAKVFSTLGIAVYNADERARSITATDPEVREKIVTLFGAEVFNVKNALNRAKLAEVVFSDAEALEKLNAIVHPRVRIDFGKWIAEQTSEYIIKEAAILIENGTHKELDALILVTADKEERIERVMKRDGVNRELVVQRMNNQMDDKDKQEFATYTIDNDDNQLVIQQVLEIHEDLISKAG